MPESKKRKRPRDVIGNAVRTMEIATGQVEEEYEDEPTKDPAAVELERRGGKKGGKAHAKNLTPKELSDIGRKGAASRWGKEC